MQLQYDKNIKLPEIKKQPDRIVFSPKTAAVKPNLDKATETIGDETVLLGKKILPLAVPQKLLNIPHLIANGYCKANHQ